MIRTELIVDNHFEGDLNEDDSSEPFTSPDLSDLGLTTIDGDILVPINMTRPEGGTFRKGKDFDSIMHSYEKWPNGVVSYWAGGEQLFR